jgi:hypothetical protein
MKDSFRNVNLRGDGLVLRTGLVQRAKPGGHTRFSRLARDPWQAWAPSIILWMLRMLGNRASLATRATDFIVLYSRTPWTALMAIYSQLINTLSTVKSTVPTTTTSLLPLGACTTQVRSLIGSSPIRRYPAV